MTFHFPDLESIRLAMTAGLVPPSVAAAPGEAAFDTTGGVALRVADSAGTKPLPAALRKIGVRTSAEPLTGNVVRVGSWPQVLPLVAVPPEPPTNAAVLFELPSSRLASLVGEMLRLGNDRQSFRLLDGDGDERALLRVVRPPYYTLLRAIDRGGESVRAYVERSPRVWIELGFDHPLATTIKPAAGQMLLLRPERDWTAVPDAEFREIYDALDFDLPTAAVDWEESQLKGRLSVPLRLTAGNPADAAELWVLGAEGVDQLDALVRDADERLMARLSFAAARDASGQATIVLKLRPSKLSPPPLTLADARAFKPYWKLPNLFLPVGKRLTPTLRRDAVRRLLADDPAQVVWLMPGDDGKFTPEVLPDAAFRPLEDWIDYVIDHDRAALSAWIDATRFDFDSFICRDDLADRPKPPPPDAKKRKPSGPDVPEPPVPPKPPKRKTDPVDTEFAVVPEVLPPSEVKLRLREAERQFLADTGPLDSPTRQALWAEIARLNALDGREMESAICWSNAVWELPEVPTKAAWDWLKAEDAKASIVPTAAEFDAAFADRDQTPNDARAFAARVLYSCTRSPVPPAFLERLPKVREFVERHEHVLGVRMVWLAWWHVAHAGGPTDVLGLARVRDRLLQRLLAEGLNKERDLPYFLRTAGERDSDRLRLVRDRALKVQKLVDSWQKRDGVEVNKPYTDLMFAFAMAKLGEVTAARDLMNAAAEKLLAPAGPDGRPDTAHEFLLKAFVFRIENAIQGKPHTGSLPASLLSRIDEIDRGRVNTASKRYVVDRMRQQSWIVDPQESLDPYSVTQGGGSILHKTLAELASINDPRQLEDAIRALIRGQNTAEARLSVYAEAISLASRLGEEFSVALIHQVPGILDATAKVGGDKAHLALVRGRQATLLTQAFLLAAHYGRSELVQSLFARFLTFLRERTGLELYNAVNQIARELLRSLRKLGLRDEIDIFLQQMQELVVQGNSLTQLRAAAGAEWPDLLGVMLSLADGWMYFGGVDRAKPFLDAARDAISANATLPRERAMKVTLLAKLARSYVGALGNAPIDDALDRIEEMLKRIERLPNGHTSSTHFSQLHFAVAEDIVRSLVSDNRSLGEQARRWLDDDEYLVRRRIHKDMKTALGNAGL